MSNFASVLNYQSSLPVLNANAPGSGSQGSLGELHGGDVSGAASTTQVNFFRGQVVALGGNATNIGIGDNHASVTTAAAFTSLGQGAGAANITADACTLIGRDAGDDLLADNCQTAVGSLALSGTANPGIGNVAIGELALAQHVGANCVGLGRRTGFASTGVNSVIIGSLSAGTAVMTGNQNSICGSQSCVALTAGADNCIFGFQSAATLTTGDDNVLIGSQANVVNAADAGMIALGTGALAGPFVANTSSPLSIVGHVSLTGGGVPGVITDRLRIRINGVNFNIPLTDDT